MKRQEIYIIGGLLIAGFLAFLFFKDKNNPPQKTLENIEQKITMAITPTINQELPKNQLPSLEIDVKKEYVAILKTTEGEIQISLNASKTPITVNNFVSLSKSKFYDNTIFHRVINGFMIQGGDPKGNGTGGPGYKFNDEPFDGNYLRGTVAMANSGPNTNGSQFFIMHKDNPLPKNYVIFGKVIKGIEVVDKIAEAQVEESFSGESSKPINPVKITSIEITFFSD